MIFSCDSGENTLTIQYRNIIDLTAVTALTLSDESKTKLN